MKAIRKVKMEVEHFEIGDQINIKLKGYGKFTATCHKNINGQALFVFDNCVGSRPMNEANTTKGGFDESDMCAWLNTELIDVFPEKYIKRMLRPEGMDHLLWLLSEEQVFGLNLPFDDQLELMRDPKHRVCSYPDGSRAAWWLRDVAHSTTFAYVNSNGSANSNSASGSNGVRPAFIIENL